jgi:hypothetical protein
VGRTVETWNAPAGRLAGALAIGSGVAYLAFFLGGAVVEAWIAAWNLLIIPAAVYTGVVVSRRGAVVAAISTVGGVAASLLWAFAYADPRLEPWWIGLAAVWWLGLGWLLRPDRRRLATFTLILGVAAAVDFVLTLLDAPMPIYALGGFKIPLTNVWTFWIGASLLRDPKLE